MSSAIQVFFRQAVREGGLPFDVTTKVPSKSTLAAMLEAERIAQDPGHPAFSDIQDLLDAYTDPWGIKVTGVTIRDVALPETMKRAIAKQAEAEREKRARIILAGGESQAAQKMKEAATLYEGVPTAIKLRELQTLAEIAREKNLIVVTQQSQSLDTGNIAALSQAIAGKKEQ